MIYFYKDSTGKTKKYIYCSLCLKGPFKEEQKNTDFFDFENSLKYCKECMQIHFPQKLMDSKKDAEFSPIDELEVEIEEQIDQLEVPKHEEIQSLENQLSLLTARQIIEKVQQLTTELITITLKNKQSIIKKASKILNSHNITSL